MMSFNEHNFTSKIVELKKQYSPNITPISNTKNTSWSLKLKPASWLNNTEILIFLAEPVSWHKFEQFQTPAELKKFTLLVAEVICSTFPPHCFGITCALVGEIFSL
jgi:hypothetical protein